jgi:N-acetyl-anhydromuramyl-L-alanine amidase AmpD
MEIVNSLLKSKNWSPGRAGPYPLDTISVHVMEGSEQAANDWFENEASDVSSNYGIAKVGRIEMYVREENTAWAQGRVFKPTAKRVLERPDANPNSYIISIEFEGSGKEPLTDAQKTSGAWLIRDIAKRRHIEISRDSVIGHHEVYAKKTCPGAISVTELVRLAQGDPAETSPPRIVYSPSLDDYLVVTRYVSDNEWYFYPMKELTRGTRAGARLSDMPLTE